MGKIIWPDYQTDEASINHLKKHLDTLSEQAEQLINQKQLTRFLSFDYIIQIVKLRTYSYKNADYWVRLIFFLKDKPNQTFTLLTLRCGDVSQYPISIDMNYLDKEKYFASNYGLQEYLNRFCNHGFNRMVRSVKYFVRDSEIYPELNEDSITEEKITRKVNNHWTDFQNAVFFEILDEYRNEISDKNPQEIKEVTKQWANKLKQQYGDLLAKRSDRAIYERLGYLDDLLAGVKEDRLYAKKDQSLFGSKKRNNGNVKSNPAHIWRNSKK